MVFLVSVLGLMGVWVLFGEGVVLAGPFVDKIDFFFSEVITFGLIERNPFDFTVFDLVLNPILDAGELGAVLEPFETIHVVEVVPEVVSFIDMFHKVNSFAF